MLKIPEYNQITGEKIDLKELEKYRFEYVKNPNYPRFSNEEYFYSFLNCAFVYEDTRAVIVRHTDMTTLELLYDLIKDGYVVKE